ncbi:MAG: hypothetical protein AAFQ80_09190 [Cyanobacteria bacterium J06621_8]
MSKICFLDNDILVKLVACNLFDEAIETLNVNRPSLIVLPSARYYFIKSKRAQRRFPENIRLKVTKIANNCQTVERLEKSVLDEISMLQKYENIDDGEATLVAATRGENSFWLITGDKRFLLTLANSSELNSIVLRLKGKVICLEQIIRQVIYKRGFEKTLANILPALQYDQSLKASFGSGKQSTEESVLVSLEAYIEFLRKQTKGMLQNI